MISVVVVDDHTVFREGLRALLSRVPEVEVVGEASNTDEAVVVTASTRPDVVLMDLNLPGGGGEVATRLILADHSATAVLVLTMHADDSHLQRALRAGARGYLLKDAEPEAIVRAIAAVHAGQAIFDPGIAGQVLGGSLLTRVGSSVPVADRTRVRGFGPDRSRPPQRCDCRSDGN